MSRGLQFRAEILPPILHFQLSISALCQRSCAKFSAPILGPPSHSNLPVLRHSLSHFSLLVLHTQPVLLNLPSFLYFDSPVAPLVPRLCLASTLVAASRPHPTPSTVSTLHLRINLLLALPFAHHTSHITHKAFRFLAYFISVALQSIIALYILASRVCMPFSLITTLDLRWLSLTSINRWPCSLTLNLIN